MRGYMSKKSLPTAQSGGFFIRRRRVDERLRKMRKDLTGKTATVPAPVEVQDRTGQLIQPRHRVERGTFRGKTEESLFLRIQISALQYTGAESVIGPLPQPP